MPSAPEVSFPDNWKAPPELSRALPREVRKSMAGTFLSIMSVCLVIGAVVVYFLMSNKKIKETSEMESLRTVGRETSAEVTRLWRTGKESTRMVAYAFTVDGRRYTGDATAPDSIWADLRTGDPLLVRYVPADPGINHPAAWTKSPFPGWMTFVIPAMLLLCVVPLVFQLRLQSALLAEGLPAPGVVTRLFRVKGGWMAQYRYRLKDGTVASGRSQMSRRIPEGSVLCVLYDPERPRRNRTYPLPWYRLADF